MCPVCGKDLPRRTPAQGEAKHCSRSCYSQSRSRRGRDGTIRCSKCLEFLPESAFHVEARRIPSRCKACVSVDRKERYDPAATAQRWEQRRWGDGGAAYYAAAMDRQGGRCAICRAPSTADARLVIDHCHRTGARRGLLCRQCNLALGLFRDDVGSLRNAVSYLHNPLTYGD